MNRIGIMAVHIGNDVPAEALKTFDDVIAEPAAHRSVDGDPVIIVQANQLAQAPVACQRARFVGDALHQTAVTKKDVGVMIDDGKTGTIKAGSQCAFGQRHTNTIGQALPQRSSGGFHAGCQAVLGMPWSARTQAPEIA